MKLHLTEPLGKIVHKYREFRDTEEFVAVLQIGEYACLAGDTKVFDYSTQTELTMLELFESGHAPHVLSKDGQTLRVIEASPVFKKGRERMYTLTLSDGRSITGSGQHRILDSNMQYVTLQSVWDAYHGGSPLPLVELPDLPLTSLGIDPSGSRQGVPHCLRKAQDCQCDCCQYLHLCDAQPHPMLRDDLFFEPLPNDAPEHSHYNLPLSEIRQGIEHTHTRLCLYGDPRSNLHSSRPCGILCDHVGCCSSTCTCTNTLSQPHQDQEHQECLLPHDLPLTELSRDNECANTFASRLYDISYTNIVTDYTIEVKGIEDVYDLHVPGTENYVAQGLIHHNSSKSTSLVDSLCITALNYPGCRLLLAGDTLTNLKRSTIPKIKDRIGLLFESENNIEATYKFPVQTHPLTGQPVQSELRCVGVDRAEIEEMMKSTEWFRVYIEEANTVPIKSFDVLLMRSRQFAFHATKKVGDLCISLSARWGCTPMEAYDILRNDPQSAVFQFKLDLDDPMPGINQVKCVMNPGGNDPMWQRFIGLPFPHGGLTPEWAENHIGIRDNQFNYKARKEIRVSLIPGNLVVTKDQQTRGYVKHVDGDKVTLFDGSVHKDEDLELILQLYTICSFADENESRNVANHQNALLAGESLRKQMFGGVVDTRSGLVFPNFDPRPIAQGGHVLPFPADGVPKGYHGIGGVDQGGGHSTAAHMALVTKRNIAIVFYEYVKSGVSASSTAQELFQSQPVGMSVRWGADPKMWSKVYTNTMQETHAQKYMDAGLYPFMQGNHGDGAFDDVVDLLEFRYDLYEGKELAGLYIFDNCQKTIYTLQHLTWHDVAHARYKWEVDVGDSLKLMLSVLNQGSFNTMPQMPKPTNSRVYTDKFAY